jgi:hypothetical protein
MFFASASNNNNSNTNNHRDQQQYNNYNNMGGAASTTTTSEQYEEALLLCSPNTRARAPSGSTAMSLMSDFQALSLSEGSKGGRDSMDLEQSCTYCNKDVYCRFSIADINNVRSKMENQPFTYQNNSFCSLDCFFEQYATKPGLCMWVDSLFSIAVKHAEFQQKSMRK